MKHVEAEFTPSTVRAGGCGAPVSLQAQLFVILMSERRGLGSVSYHRPVTRLGNRVGNALSPQLQSRLTSQGDTTMWLLAMRWICVHPPFNAFRIPSFGGGEQGNNYKVSSMEERGEVRESGGSKRIDLVSPPKEF